MTTTQNLGIPLFESNETVTMENFNSRLDNIDQVAASRQNLETCVSELVNHKTDYTNPHSVTVNQIGGSNANLLHNWDFRNPVNSKGQSSYTALGYTIDRWNHVYNTGVITLTDQGLEINSTSSNMTLLQELQGAQYLRGETLTYSIEAVATSGSNAVGAYTIYFVCLDSYDTEIGAGVAGTSYQHYSFDAIGIQSISRVIPENTARIQIKFASREGATVTFKRVKLEINSVSTLANDLPIDYPAEKMLCQHLNDDGSYKNEASNKNILHNWDFRNPVNQRGQSSYSGSSVYGIDRWQNGNDSTAVLTVNTGYVTATTTNSPYDHNWLWLQKIENPDQLIGKQVTLSFEAANAVNTAVFARIGNSSDSYIIVNHMPISAEGITSLTFTVPEGTGTMRVGVVTDGVIGTTASVDLFRAKFENGPVSTLANDPPADYGEELTKCQRYCIKLAGAYINCYFPNTTNIRVPVSLPCVMRTSPAIEQAGQIGVVAGNGTTDTITTATQTWSYSHYGVGTNLIVFNVLCGRVITCASTFTSGVVFLNAGVPVILSADL